MRSSPVEPHVSLAPRVPATTLEEHLFVEVSYIDSVTNSDVENRARRLLRSAIQESHLRNIKANSERPTQLNSTQLN